MILGLSVVPPLDLGLLLALCACSGAGRLLVRLFRIDLPAVAAGNRESQLPNRATAWGWSYLLGLTLVAVMLQLPLALFGRIPDGWFNGRCCFTRECGW